VAPRLASGGARLMLETNGIAKIYGSGPKATHAVENVTFSIADGEFVCVVGPSGCGKTTLLKCIAGLMRPTRGEVLLRGKRVLAPPEELALVFQEYSRSLMPWSTVRNNVLLPLRHKRLSGAERKRLVEESLESVGLTRFIDHYPWQLSGGMQQRVAIARALALDPKILLMDEPFGALDELTRNEMQDELLRVWSARRKTLVFVTHSIWEGLMLADRVIVMAPHPGRIVLERCIDVPRPRNRTDLTLLAIYDEVWAALGHKAAEAAPRKAAS
jgi:NitT/TauT family transport system ATP-binding protein